MLFKVFFIDSDNIVPVIFVQAHVTLTLETAVYLFYLKIHALELFLIMSSCLSSMMSQGNFLG